MKTEVKNSDYGMIMEDHSRHVSRMQKVMTKINRLISENYMYISLQIYPVRHPSACHRMASYTSQMVTLYARYGTTI